jgi:hypothetical protein
MNDNKDITEFEYEIEAIINRATSISGELDIKEVINCLREIMPPVCSKTERKFLDRIKQVGELVDYEDMGLSNEILFRLGKLDGADFPDINLQELVK